MPTKTNHPLHRRPKILLLGDSLTQTSFEGWGATLANVYQRRCDVLNRGYSGYNTRFFLHLLPSILREDVLPGDDSSTAVSLVVIWFGANDAALKDVDPHHHVPLDEYADNLRSIVGQIRTSHPKANILMVSPPPVHHGQRLDYQRQRYGDRATGVLERKLEVTVLYAAQCQAVASELNVPLLDVFHSMQQQQGDGTWACYLSDGLHFAPPGHEFVARELLRAIAVHFPSLAITPDPATGQFCNSGSACPGLAAHGPYHDQIDANRASEAF